MLSEVRANRNSVNQGFLYCSAVWCSAADTCLKLLDRVVSDAQFLTGSVFKCDIAHPRSVAVLCMLYKIRCNLMHPLNGDQPGSNVTVRSHIGTLMHCLTAEPCRTPGLLLTSHCPSGMILLIPYLIEWDSWASRAGPMLLYCLNCSIPTIPFFSFSFCL